MTGDPLGLHRGTHAAARAAHVTMMDAMVVGDVDEGAVLTARSLTEATIWGAHGTWRLQLRTQFEPTRDGWLATRTIESTW